MWAAVLLVTAASAQVDVDFLCSPGNGDPIVGLPPLEVRCVVDAPVGATWQQTTWLWGDGGTTSGDAVSHVYEGPGQYSVSVILEGFVEQDSVTNPSRRVDALVTVCGEPDPSFTFIDKGGRDYQLVNTTDVGTPQCIDQLLWEVFQGRKRDGQPLLTFEGWEPRFELPQDGTYTVVLTVGGIGGTSAASLELEAMYGLTDDLKNRTAECATAPPSAGWMAASLGLLTLSRRRAPR